MESAKPQFVAEHSSRCTCAVCWAKPGRHCGHIGCHEDAISEGDGRAVVCKLTADEADDCCDHGISSEDHHGCAECAMERAEAMADLRREGS